MENKRKQYTDGFDHIEDFDKMTTIRKALTCLANAQDGIDELTNNLLDYEKLEDGPLKTMKEMTALTIFGTLLSQQLMGLSGQNLAITENTKKVFAMMECEIPAATDEAGNPPPSPDVSEIIWI